MMRVKLILISLLCGCPGQLSGVLKPWRVRQPSERDSSETLGTILLATFGRSPQRWQRSAVPSTQRGHIRAQLKGERRALPEKVSPTPQVLRLRDAVTNQEISIVGTIHHNPVSITRTKEEILACLARKDNKLAAVVIELCETRWNRSATESPFGSRAYNLLPSEFREAAELAQQNGVPVMLGDPEVNELLGQAKNLYSQSIKDLLNPINGGWQSIFEDISRNMRRAFDTSDIARSDLLLSGEEPSSLSAFSSLEMLRGFLPTFWRYPMVLAKSSPSMVIRGASLWLTYMSGYFYIKAVLAAGDAAEMPVVGEVASGLNDAMRFNLATLELSTALFFIAAQSIILILVRVFAVIFYEERDIELARSIRRAAAETNGPVVAIVGGLHMNGIARFLLSKVDSDNRSLDSKGVWLKVSRNTSWE